MRCEKHIIYIEKGGQARILFLECGLVRFFYGMTKAFLALTKASVGDIFPFLGVHAIILINFSFSRKAKAEKSARMLAIVVTKLLRESRTLFEHPY